MKLATIYVSGVSARVVQDRPVPVSIIGAYVDAIFDDDWDGLARTAVIQGVVTKDILDVQERFELPQETVSEAGFRLRIGFYGVSPDGSRAIPTLWADLGVIQEAADPSGDLSTDPSLPVWAQLLAIIGNSGGIQVPGAAPGQILAVKAVDGNSYPSEWEAVDRECWTEKEAYTEILSERILVYADSLGIFEVADPVPALVVGKNYTVKWNDVEYVCTAQEHAMDDMILTVLGNLKAAGGEDSGEPFAIARFPDNAVAQTGVYLAVMPLDESESPTLAIFSGSIVIHKLDNKYLALDWLPVMNRADLIPEQTVTAEDNGEGNFVAKLASNWYIPHGESEEVAVYIDGNRYEGIAFADYDGMFVYPKAVETRPYFAGNYIIAKFVGSWLIASLVEGTCTVRVCKESPNRMPEEFVPESVSGVVIRSSTPGSSKRFLLTVDDAGSVAATEI